MIIVLLLLFQSLCLYCQRLVLHIHDRCFPRNARLLQELAETVGDRKALQRLEDLEVEQCKRRQKRRILEPILPLGAGANLEACRFCAHSPQGYCRHHFHLQLCNTRRPTGAGEQDYKQLRKIRRELKRSLEQQQPGRTSGYSLKYSYQGGSSNSLSSGYASLSPEENATRWLDEQQEELEANINNNYPEEQQEQQLELEQQELQVESSRRQLNGLSQELKEKPKNTCNNNQVEEVPREELTEHLEVQQTEESPLVITSHL